MPTFNSFNNQNNESNNQVVYDFSDKQSKGLFLTKVFGMMFICLLITTLVAAGLGFPFQYLLTKTMVVEGEVASYDQNLCTGFLVMLVASAIGLLVMSFVLPMMFAKGKHNIIVPLMIYVVLMGVLLSTLVIFLDWVILAEAFGITCLIFGVMALLGYVSKGKLTGIGFILLGLLIGAGALSLVNWLMIFIGGMIQPQNIMLSWIVSLMIFAFLMFVTLYDVYRIKKIAENGSQQNNNLVYYCAYILYSDFIALLVRVVYYLAIFTRRR